MKVVQREKRVNFMGFLRNLWVADPGVINDDNKELNNIISGANNISREEKEELLNSLDRFRKIEKDYDNSYKGHKGHKEVLSESKKVVNKVNVDKSIGGYTEKKSKTNSKSIDKTR